MEQASYKQRRASQAGSGSPAVSTLVTRFAGRSQRLIRRRIAWSPDGKWLSSPSSDNTICIWDASCSGNTVSTWVGHSTPPELGASR